MPIEVQDRIRQACGDRPAPDGKGEMLPATCDVSIDPALVARAAGLLRSRLDLAEDLTFHLSELVVFLAFAESHGASAKRIVDDIDGYVGKAEKQ